MQATMTSWGVLVNFVLFGLLVAILVVVSVNFSSTTYPSSNLQTPATNSEIVNGSSQNGYVIGPFCYGNTCQISEVTEACQKLGGTSYGDGFCYLKKPVDVYGPFCSLNTCQVAAGERFCNDIGGENVSGRFCIKARS